MDDRTGKMVYVWGDPTFVVSNFDPGAGHEMYAAGCVAVTVHYDGDFENAGSLLHKSALFVDELSIPELIAALHEFVDD